MKLLFAEMTRERDIQRAILQWLNLQPKTRAWRRNTGAVQAEYRGKKRFVQFNHKGMADIWFITSGGRHGEVEVKSPGKKTTEAQDRWLMECAKLQALCFVADDLDSFIAEWKKAGL
jgi:VRR-NUC domain-containing protein